MPLFLATSGLSYFFFINPVMRSHNLFERNIHLSKFRTKNEKDFGLEALGSGIGGFVGIFLGYSVLNVVDLFDTNWNSFWKETKAMLNFVNIWLFIITCFVHKRKFIINLIFAILESGK